MEPHPTASTEVSNLNSSQLKVWSRTVLAAVAIVYPLWALFMRFALPNAWDAPWERVCVGIFAGIVWILISRNKMRVFSDWLALFVPYVCLIHYSTLVVRSHFEVNYQIGFYVILLSFNNIFWTFRQFFVFCLAAIAASIAQTVAGSWLLGSSFSNLPLGASNYIGGIVTIQIVSALFFFQRDKLFNSVLRLQQEAAEQKVTAELEKRKAIVHTTQMLVHDVRQPLAILKLLIESFRRLKSIEEVGRYTEKAEANLQRTSASLDNHIADLMDVDSPVVVRTMPTEPVELLHAALEQVFLASPKASVKIDTQLLHKYSVLADPKKLTRVFQNVFANAVQAIQAQGEIWIRTSDASSVFRITIGNDGPKIAPEHHTKIFDIFFTHNKKGGTGLGLHICKRIVEAHQGTIRLEPDCPKGTEFTITLPSAQNHPARHEHTFPKHSMEFTQNSVLDAVVSSFHSSVDTANSAGNAAARIQQLLSQTPVPFQILLADDSEFFRGGLEAILDTLANRSPKIEVSHANTPQETITLAQLNAPDLIVLDIDFNDIKRDGWDVLREIREGGVRSFIAMHSSRATPRDHERAKDLGAQVLIPKPMSTEQLTSILEQAFRHARQP